jgi:LEA14-like dessication related protein
LLSFPQNKSALWLFLIASLSLGSCSYDNVEFKDVRQVKIDQLDNKGISFTATLWIENPNDYRIKVTGSDADLYLGGKHAGRAKLLSNVIVPANYKGTIDAQVRTDFDEGSLSMLPVIISAGLKRKVDLRAAGTVQARSFLIGRKFAFDYSHEAKF